LRPELRLALRFPQDLVRAEWGGRAPPGPVGPRRSSRILPHDSGTSVPVRLGLMRKPP